MKYIYQIWDFFKRFKYPIIGLAGLLYVGLLDSNSWLVRYQNSVRQAKMQEEIDMYNNMNAENMKILKELKNDPKAMRRIAREKYFMKEEDEDIFVLSDDNNNLQ